MFFIIMYVVRNREYCTKSHCVTAQNQYYMMTWPTSVPRDLKKNLGVSINHDSLLVYKSSILRGKPENNFRGTLKKLDCFSCTPLLSHFIVSFEYNNFSILLESNKPRRNESQSCFNFCNCVNNCRWIYTLRRISRFVLNSAYSWLLF